MVYGAFYLWIMNCVTTGVVFFVSSLVMLAELFLLRATGSYALAAHLLGAVLLANVFWVAWLENGFVASTLLWTLPIAIVGPHLVGMKGSLFWALLCCVGFSIVYAATEYGWKGTPVIWITPAMERRVTFYVLIGLIMVTLGLSTVLESLLTRSTKEKAAVEEELRQAQKLESIGLLAGGVAHDFNNLLSVVITDAHLLRDELSFDDPRRTNVERISVAAERAADLTRQLLQFSRKDIVRLEILNLNDVISEITDLLRRSLGETIEMHFEFAPALWNIKSDRRHIQQVLLNLAVNARDAMGNGGSLTIRTANLTDIDGKSGRLELPPGRYVQLFVRDNGRGMSEEIKSRAFEPFFTTKPIGKGSGLGLSTVYGIVKKSQGFISLESREGEGTTFTITLPISDENAASPGDVAALAATRAKLPFSYYTLLLAEDDDAVRAATRRLLSKMGFEVLTARSGDDALRICKNYTNEIHVLLTDVVMPGMSGSQLAEEAVRYRPQMLVVYMSGYPDDETVRHGVSQGRVIFIQKPFSEATLQNTLVTALSQADAGSPR
jgi:two-component system cell cycle sensor histidine kinase/response regulator CckA